MTNIAYRTLELIAAPWTTAYVVMNNEDEAALQTLLPDSDTRTLRIPSIGIDTLLFDRASVDAAEISRLRDFLREGRMGPIFIMVAEFHPNKRHVDTLHAFQLLADPQATLVLLGSGTLQDHLIQTVERLGISPQVRFMGYQSDIRPWLCASDAFVLASDREGLPRAMLEAMALGVPVIGTRTRGISDLLAGSPGIEVSRRSPDELESALRRVSSHQMEYSDASRDYSSTIRQLHDYTFVTAQYDALYDELVTRQLESDRGPVEHMRNTILPPTSSQSDVSHAHANQRQSEYYDRVALSGTYESAAPSLATRLWSRVRQQLWSFREDAGLDDLLESRQKEWLADIASLDVLEVGAGTGSLLTNWLVSNARSYTAIDLSDESIAKLASKHMSQFPSNQFVVGDILANSFPEDAFSAVYACSVVHHFEDLRPVMAEFSRILQPGGKIVTFDPLQTERMNRLARSAYRPFQADREWEFPFTRKSLAEIEAVVDIEEVQGVLGRAKYVVPLYFIPGLRRKAVSWSRDLAMSDSKQYRTVDDALFTCWQISMLLKKRNATSRARTEQE